MRAPAAPDDSDEALMLAYAAGHAGSFDALYARHKGGTYRYILRHVRDAGVADELFQDVWMNAIRARASYQPTAKFTTWIYTLAHNRVVDFWRGSGTAKLVSIDADGVDGDDNDTRSLVESMPGSSLGEPERQATSSELGAHLRAALDSLPEEQRDAFLLQYEAGLSLAEIARTTGVGQETVKSRLRYATSKLRAALAGLRDTWQP